MKNTSILLCIGLLTLTGSLVAPRCESGAATSHHQGLQHYSRGRCPTPGVSILYSNLGSRPRPTTI